MKHITRFISLFYFSLLILLSHQQEITSGSERPAELKLVQILFRHGDRNAEYAYPTDPFQDESYWPGGWGQLTKVGKKQAFELGTFLRDRYKDYFSSEFTPDELYTLSSDKDRTIMSAQLVLAGLFPVDLEDYNASSVTDNWSDNINWQPIPLHTIRTEDDNLLRMKRNCPRFQKLLNEYLLRSESMKSINEAEKDNYAEWSRLSGDTVKNINDIDSFYSTVIVENMKGFDMPNWTIPLLESEHFNSLYNLSFAIKTETVPLRRLRMGPLLSLLKGNFEEKMSSIQQLNETELKGYFLSGHDTTMVELLNSLRLYDNIRPSYSSVIIFELWQNGNKHSDSSTADSPKFFVNILYRNDTTMEPLKLTMPACKQFNCPIDQFFDYVNPFLLQGESWETECQLSILEHYSIPVLVALGLTALIGLLVVIALVVIMCKKTRSRRGYQEM